MKPFNKILVPTDFSKGADHALANALELRQRFGGTITLLHVYELPMVYTDVYAFSADLIGAIENSARTATAKALEAAQKRARDLGSSDARAAIDCKVLMGQPSSAIVDEAKGGSYDLIVMGTHGRTGLSHLFIGSVAERVVRGAPCPVLTVRDG